MSIKRPRSGGGWKAIAYSFRLARRVGWWKLWQAARSKNTCKTCAVGMGGQLGGMVNEGGHFPEVCKKSFQAMASDLQGAVRREWIEQATLPQLRAMSSRELEMAGRLSEPLYLAPGARSYQVVSWDQALNAIAQKMSAAGPQRIPSLPDMPAIAEAGVSGMDINISFGMYAPKGTPKAEIDLLSKALQAAVTDPEVKGKLDGMGVTAVPPELAKPEALRTHLRKEIDVLGGLLLKAGVTPE